MKKSQLYDVVCTMTKRDGEQYTQTVGTKLDKEEAQKAMVDVALSNLEYNGTIYFDKDEFCYDAITDRDAVYDKAAAYVKEHGAGMNVSVEQWDGVVLDYVLVSCAKKPTGVKLTLTKAEVKFLKTLFNEHIDEVSDMVDDAKTLFSLDEKIQKL